jgi:hypothetical protein
MYWYENKSMPVLYYGACLKHNINMNRLDPDKRAKAVAALVEGNSIRAVARMTSL